MFGQSDFSASAMPGRAEPAGVAQSQPLRDEFWSPSVVAELAEVLANDEVNKEYRHLVVRCGDVSASAAPGQFFQLLCPQTGGEQPFLRRPMSFYGADPERRQVEFLYKIAGAGTRGLAVLRAGDQLDIMGPLGIWLQTRSVAASYRCHRPGGGSCDTGASGKSGQGKRDVGHGHFQRTPAGASRFGRFVPASGRRGHRGDGFGKHQRARQYRADLARPHRRRTV